VVAFVTALLLVYVIPYYYRRTMILAEARIDERYAEDLRMLRLPAGQVAEHAADGRGAHGTVFFRQPEVVMSTGRGSQGTVPAGKDARESSRAGEVAATNNAVSAAADVRALAKARARRRARMSQRIAKQQRGLLGGGALGVLAVVFWILAAATAFPVGVALAATAVTGAYFVGLGYIMSEMNKASQADREAIAEINAKLGTGSMRREASGTARRPSAPRSWTSHGTPADSGSSHSRKQSGITTRSAGMPRRDGKASKPSGQAPAHAPEQVGASSRGKQSVASSARKAQGARMREEGRHDASTRAARGISLTLDESFVGGGAHAPAASADRAARSTATAAQASNAVAAPSYTLKPRQIERRVVAPYQAPAQPEAAVPYRPQRVAENYDSTSASAVGSASSVQATPGERAVEQSGQMAAGRTGESTTSSTAGRPHAGGQPDGLAGGSVLDALLARRRA
jgi:hypothetical protein